MPKKRKAITIATKKGNQNRKQNEARINQQIRGYRECRLIDTDGVQLGIYELPDALQMAKEKHLDLVEISPKAVPPVCRIMDYGKFKYDRQKKEKANRKNSKAIEDKEMKFRPGINENDYETKRNHVRRFLEKGQRVKVTIMFRGRELSHQELGLDILDKLAADVEDIASIIQAPQVEGRNMTMLLAPNSQVKS